MLSRKGKAAARRIIKTAVARGKTVTDRQGNLIVGVVDDPSVKLVEMDDAGARRGSADRDHHPAGGDRGDRREGDVADDHHVKRSDPKHLEWIRSRPCCVPGCRTHTRVVPAHVRTAANSGTGLKPPDRCTVPLCHVHHMEQHRGNKSFEQRYGLDLLALAAEYAAASGCDLI